MKKILLVLIPALLLVGCAKSDTSNNSSLASSETSITESSSEAITSSELSSSESASEESSSSEEVNPLEGKSLKVDYLNYGGAGIPENWEDTDNGNTVRSATFTISGVSFSLDFVGKWKISTKNEELQTKKDPVSYIRAASDVVVKRIEVETFEADVGVYTTRDHSGSKINGTKATAVHSDGQR